ncbi:MAG: hypothetical protein Q8N87_02300 [bacterium]|nr:hypothetical protein [bacterium]
MNFKEVIKILSLIFLAGAIAFSPSFSVGTLADGKIIEIRIEDILIFVFGLLLIISFLASEKTKIERPPLFFPILAWLGIGLLSVLTNWVFSNLSLDRGFFYFLKEFLFFVFYFYVFWGIKKIDTAKLLVKIWLLFALVNVLYVLYQMATGFRAGEYGTAAIGEWGVFPTGAFFLLLFIFLFNVFLYYFLHLNISIIKKIGLGLLTFSPVLGVFGSASKTNFFALVLALFLTFFFFFLRKINFKTILVFILAIVFMVSMFSFALKNVHDTIRVKEIIPVFSLEPLWENYKSSRLTAIKPIFKASLESSAHFPFLGMGKGYVGEAHNQYLRNFIEVGIIGSLIFFILIFAIIKKSWQGFSRNRDGFAVGLSAGLLVATLALLFISFATEPVIVVKPSSVYWFFAAITMAVLNLNERH